MHLQPNPSQTTPFCKLKRVYPRLPLRVHSAAAKGLARVGVGNPLRAEPAAKEAVRRLDRSCDRPRLCRENEASSAACWTSPWVAGQHERSVDDGRVGAPGVSR
jgi:hypothetical protein